MKYPLGFRFDVYFLAAGALPNPLDTRFRRVSGLGTTVETKTYAEGGQNLYRQKLPTGTESENLVLERGIVVGSPLTLEFNSVMTTFQFFPSDVLVTLYDEAEDPICGWLLTKAFPVKWSTSDLDADKKELVIETLELAYSHRLTVRV